MAIADARNAEEYATHPEGKGFVFQIQAAVEQTSAKGNPMIVMSFINVDNDRSKPPFKMWVMNSDDNYLLRKLIEACNVQPGDDPTAFEGKMIQADLIHEKNGDAVFCKLVPKSITAWVVRSHVEKDDDLPF